MQTFFLQVLASEPKLEFTLTRIDADGFVHDAQLPVTAKNTSLPNHVLTIGNYDGVHLGHQAMIARLHDLKAQLNKTSTDNIGQSYTSDDALTKTDLKSVVMTFEPQPREYFAKLQNQPEVAPPRLTNLSEKQCQLAKHNIDIMLVSIFDDTFRSLTAAQFAMLLKRLGTIGLVLGDDFRFGQDRTGDGSFLQSQGLSVVNLQTVYNDNQHRISSTRVRDALKIGDLTSANALLGYDYSITGIVMAGDQIGRTLNFPTANVALNRIQPAVHGVFAVDVVMRDDTGNIIVDGFEVASKKKLNGVTGRLPHSLFGVASVGTRPSIDGATEWRLEVFFPKFAGDLYGKNLEVRFLHYLHGEKKYASLDDLKTGIQHDVIEALKWREHNLTQ